ncbi:outer membrane usher protein [Escherichia coli]|nr:outer membrane usher protein [Escherichia coli]
MKTCITKGIVTVSLTAILLSCSSAWAAGKGGIGLAATRLVYSEGEEQISLGVRNTSPDVPYLIQSWVMTPDNKKSADFIITPPLFVLNPANENLLRIMYIGAPLAKDRETLFFTSVRAVPSTTKRKEGNTLKIATQSVIKLFWRPKGLAYPLGEAPAKLRCTSSADMVTVSNPTPYFITLTDLKIGGKVVKNQMISPFDKYQLNSGVNLGPWRLRNNSTWSRSSGQTAEWKNLSSYLQRAVIPLKGELTVGDDYTAGDFFDSVSFRGVQLASDDNMLPDSLKGFAPVVRGIAKSNAQITIKQNGYTIYQTYVSPGAFEISDLYSTSSSGDLLVEIKEADGSVNSYSVPFSSVPLLQGQGRIKYAVTLAKYRTNSNEQQESKFAQATLQWGGPWGTTWYGGGQYAEYYRAAMFGLGFNLGDFGAISFDATQAKSTLADQSEHKGQSYRFLYAKTLNHLGTNFQLMGYRYSTSGFYTLSDTMYKHMDGYEFNDGDDEDTPMWSRYYNLFYTKRGKLQVNISQQLGEYGSFYLSGSQQTYWHTDQQDRLLQFGYNTQIKDLSLGISWNYSKSRGQPDADQVFALNFSLPLNLLLPRSNDSYTRKKNYAWMTSNTSIDNEGHTTQNLGLTETLLDDSNLSYSVQQGYNSEGKTANGSASMDYKGAFADARVGYNYSDNGSQQQLNYALSGSLVAHSQGITLGQSLGETNVLIAAPGAENTRVANSTGLKTDWRGYTVVPYATSYRENRIALDAASLKRNVDLENAVVNVVPTKGALVLAEFNAHAGARVLMKTSKQGIPLRFGAIATLDGVQANSGIIDDDGSLYMAGLPAKGTISVRWGEAPDQICHINYELTEQQINSAITRMDAICR